MVIMMANPAQLPTVCWIQVKTLPLKAGPLFAELSSLVLWFPSHSLPPPGSQTTFPQSDFCQSCPSLTSPPAAQLPPEPLQLGPRAASTAQANPLQARLWLRALRGRPCSPSKQYLVGRQTLRSFALLASCPLLRVVCTNFPLSLHKQGNQKLAHTPLLFPVCSSGLWDHP